MKALRCPECGSQLLSDGKSVWCSFVGSQCGPVRQKACDYGISSRVPLSEFEAGGGIVRVAEGLDLAWRDRREKEGKGNG